MDVEQTMLRPKGNSQETLSQIQAIALSVLMEMQIESSNSNSIIIYSIEEEGKLRLIDGDRQGTVFTEFFKKITDKLAEKVNRVN